LSVAATQVAISAVSICCGVFSGSAEEVAAEVENGAGAPPSACVHNVEIAGADLRINFRCRYFGAVHQV
jgi:hypothetical protein